MKQSYAVPHGPQELCVQLFDELCFPDEEFCEQRVRLKLTLNDTSQLQRMRSNRHCIDFVLFCHFFCGIHEQAVPAHTESDILSRRRSCHTFDHTAENHEC